MNPARHFRWASAADADVLADIMFDAVRNGESRYTEMQRAAWVPAPRGGPAWRSRLQGQDIILAERQGKAVGFLSLAEGGYVDFAYIRPEAQHTGLFRQLLARLNPSPATSPSRNDRTADRRSGLVPASGS